MNMKKIFVSLIFCLMFGGVASANIIYTTASGDMGLIKISSVTSVDVSKDIYKGNAGSVTAPYWENNTSAGKGNSKIILITPKESSDTTVSGDTGLIFSEANLSAPTTDEDDPIVFTGTYGTPIITSTNGGASFYLASGASIREYLTSNFALRNSYTHASNDISPNPEIKGIVTNDTRVYALVSRNNTVSNDLMLALDGMLTLNTEYASTWELENVYDANAVTWLSNSRIAVGARDGVYTVGSTSSTSIVSSDNPVVALCSDTSNGCYYITQSDDNGTKKNSLWHYTNSDTDPTQLLANIEGNSAQLVRDNTYNVLTAIIGEQITLFNLENNDAVIQTYTATELGGTLTGGVPISAATTSTTGNSASSGSSGCEIGGFGVTLLAVLFAGFK